MARRSGGRGGRAGDEDGDVDAEDEVPRVDLHGLRPSEALAAVGRAVHAARVRGATALVVVTGRGASNGTGTPVLRERVEEWTRSSEARTRGVKGFERIARGGALRLALLAR